MKHNEVQLWLDRYVSAWESNEPAEIGALFSEDAVYSYRPWENEKVTARGREAIVASWLEDPDDPSNWEAHYEPYVVEGNKAVALGWSKYRPQKDGKDRIFHNAYFLAFDDDGRCKSFHEFYFLEGD